MSDAFQLLDLFAALLIFVAFMVCVWSRDARSQRKAIGVLVFFGVHLLSRRLMEIRDRLPAPPKAVEQVEAPR